MEENTPINLLDKYDEKINSVGYKLKEAIGHPVEQMRLVMQLKVYINSLINDLNKLDADKFDHNTDISQLYDLAYGILTSITTISSGITLDVTGSDTDVVMTKDTMKEATIQKFKLMLGGVDKIMRYLDTLNKPAQESTFFEEIGFANESGLNYNKMRKAQTSKLGLFNQYMAQRHECEKRYNDAKGNPEKESSFKAWLEKQKKLTQRKINGTEIKDKKALQKNITLYDSYLHKLGGVANESSIYDDLLVGDTTFTEDIFN